MLQLNDRSGNKRPLWLVDSEYKIGSAAGSELKLEGAGIADHEATLTVADDAVSITPKNDSGQIKVNGNVIQASVVLSHGDSIEIGTLVFDLLDPKQRKQAPAAKPISSPHLWRLKPLNSALSSREFVIESSVVLGRSKECDITLGVSHLSRRHAELRVMPGGLEVIDLKSSNGTYVNGKKVSKAILRAGDELSFDTLRFQVVSPVRNDSAEPSEDDLDKTTMRPAISSAEVEKLGAESASSKPRASEAHRAKRAIDKPLKTSQPIADTPATTEESSSNGKYIVLAVAVVALGVAGWFFIA